VGVIEPGKYTFSTDCEERMTVIAGELNVKLPGESWRPFAKNSTFIVPPNVSFDVDAKADAAYICYYKR